MQKVLTAILPCGILPALDQQISQAGELGIFENQNCLQCREDKYKFPESVLADFIDLPQFLPMYSGQIFFQTLCTKTVESFLLGMIQDAMYVFVFDIEM